MQERFVGNFPLFMVSRKEIDTPRFMTAINRRNLIACNVSCNFIWQYRLIVRGPYIHICIRRSHETLRSLIKCHQYILKCGAEKYRKEFSSALFFSEHTEHGSEKKI